MSDIFGILDIGQNLAGQLFADERQEDAQQFAAGQAAIARAREDTRHQRNITDLKRAGLNPMLSYMNSASAPISAVQGSAGIASAGGGTSIAAAQQSASQIEVNEAMRRRTDAEAEKIKAEEAEIRARTPRHAVDIEHVRQQIGESAVRIEELWARASSHTATAAQATQQAANLKETIPLIRTQVQQLRALTEQATAATSEIRQRVKAQLPQLEAILHKLEATSRQMQLPGRANEERAQESLIGQIGAYLRALNPLRGFIQTIK